MTQPRYYRNSTRLQNITYLYVTHVGYDGLGCQLPWPITWPPPATGVYVLPTLMLLLVLQYLVYDPSIPVRSPVWGWQQWQCTWSCDYDAMRKKTPRMNATRYMTHVSP